MRAEDHRHHFYRLSTYLQKQYGERVYKVSIRAGFTCPNRDGKLARGGCSFCAGAALEPTGFERGQTIEQQLENGLSYLDRRHGAHKVIAYYQDYSATYADAQTLRSLYAAPLEHPRVVGMAVGTRPDCLAKETLDVLDEVAARKDLWVELGLQIADDALLDQMGRAHRVADFVNAVELLHRAGIRVCVHVMIGFPGSRPALEQKTADLLSKLSIWGVKLHAFHVLRGTRLAKQHAQTPLPLLTRDQHAERVVDFIERLPPETVVHRITGEAPRKLTIAPEWTINKMACFDQVLATFARRQTHQGRKHG
jgi:radical SAM protein (TIGR01212 family)